jgi:hypothetical protein
MLSMAQLLVSWFPLLREAGPMAPERFTPNLLTMSRIMEKLSGQIKPVIQKREAILFLLNVSICILIPVNTHLGVAGKKQLYERQ